MSDDTEITSSDAVREFENSTETTETVEIGAFQFEGFYFRPENEEYGALFDSAAMSPSTAVVALMSKVTGIDPMDIDPLYSTVDPEHLDALLQPDGAGNTDVRIQFSWLGHSLELTDYGRITVWPKGAREG